MKNTFTTIAILTGAPLATATGFALAFFQVPLPGVFESAIGFGTIAGILGLLMLDQSPGRPNRPMRPRIRKSAENCHPTTATGRPAAICTA